MDELGATHDAIPPLLAWPLLSLFSGLDLGTASNTSGTSNINVTVRRPGKRTRVNEDVEEALLQNLLQLRVSDYESLVARLLQAIGYEQVRVLRGSRPIRRSHKGRTQHGGVDIMAWSRAGVANDRVLVQVKQYERLVSRRFVDELRGALLRTQSRHALLITTSRFAPAARRAAQEDHIAPIHLMSGQRLCRLLMRYQIGVQHNRHGDLQVDDSFFKRLHASHTDGTGASDAVKPGKQSRRNHGPICADQAKQPDQLGTSIATPNLSEKGGEMMGRTHALIGTTTLWLFHWSGTLNHETLAFLVLVAVGGALAPDLDAQDSLVKRFAIAGLRPFVPLSQLLHGAFGHRGLLHSLLGLGLFTLLCGLPLALWLGWPFGVALSLGYASHLLADAATKSGVPLLYPRRRRYHLLPRPLRLTTGSAAEDAVFALAAGVVLWLLLQQLPMQQLPTSGSFSSL
ncbi:MAG: inner rane protein [Abditibacteriota bacterium]|nr:inner rane protein [Abditibacteriota bacterium]